MGGLAEGAPGSFFDVAVARAGSDVGACGLDLYLHRDVGHAPLGGGNAAAVVKVDGALVLANGSTCSAGPGSLRRRLSGTVRGIMAARPDIDRFALQLAERVIQLLDRGSFTTTYKDAVLVAIMDLCMERTSATGEPPEVLTTRQLAEKVVELYWLHCAPYPGKRAVLAQNWDSRNEALILRYICRFREGLGSRAERALPLSRARAAAPDAYEALVREVEWKLIEMPLCRLQVIGRDEDAFLYRYNFSRGATRGSVQRYQRDEASEFDNRLTLQPGVAAALVALNGVLRPLIHRHWATLVAGMNGLGAWPLEEFLFGAERISLDPVRPWLRDLQGGRCFYCGRGVPASCDVDHFVPWSRHADNSIDNLVVAHSVCNGKKRDFLAAAEHVARWRERSASAGVDLRRIAEEERWEHHPERTLSVARSIYLILPEGARLWRAGSQFVKVEDERPRLAAALAA